MGCGYVLDKMWTDIKEKNSKVYITSTALTLEFVTELSTVDYTIATIC
jgi:hypothetical protein